MKSDSESEVKLGKPFESNRLCVHSTECRLVIIVVVINHADGGRLGRVFSSSYLSISLFSHTISQKPLQLRSPNLTRSQCSTVSPGNPFILRSRSRGAQKQCQRRLLLSKNPRAEPRHAECRAPLNTVSLPGAP